MLREEVAVEIGAVCLTQWWHGVKLKLSAATLVSTHSPSGELRLHRLLGAV
jgi:hypothetical protein